MKITELRIRKLEIDFDTNVLKINGEPVVDKPTIVTLPGPDGWPYRKLFNAELVMGNQEECDRLDVAYRESINSKTW